MQRNIFDIIPTEILQAEVSTRITEKTDIQTILLLSKTGFSFFDSEKVWKLRIQHEFNIDWNSVNIPLSITSAPRSLKQLYIHLNRLHLNVTSAEKQKDFSENKELAIACCTDNIEYVHSVLQKEKIGKCIIAAIAAQSHRITDSLINSDTPAECLLNYLEFAIGTANVVLIKRLLNMCNENKIPLYKSIKNDEALKYLHYAIKKNDHKTVLTLLDFADENENGWLTPTAETLILCIQNKQEKLALFLFDLKKEDGDWLFSINVPLLVFAIEFGLKKLAKKMYQRRLDTAVIHPFNSKRIFSKSVEYKLTNLALTLLVEETMDGTPVIDINTKLYQSILKFAPYRIIKEILARNPSIKPTMEDVFIVIRTQQKTNGNERSKVILLLLKEGHLSPTPDILHAAIKIGRFLLVKKLMQIKNLDDQPIFIPTLELLITTLKSKKRNKTALEIYQQLKSQLSLPEMITLLETSIHYHVDISIDLINITQLKNKPKINFYFNYALCSNLPNKDQLTLHLIKLKNENGKFIIPFSTYDFVLAVKEKCQETASYIFHHLKELNLSQIPSYLLDLLVSENYTKPLQHLLEIKRKNKNLILTFSVQLFNKAIANYDNNINNMILNIFAHEIKKTKQEELITLLNQAFNHDKQDLCLQLLKSKNKHGKPLITPTVNILSNAIESEFIAVVSYLMSLKDNGNNPLLNINEQILADAQINDDNELYDILLCYNHFRMAAQAIKSSHTQIANSYLFNSQSHSVKYFCLQMEMLLEEGSKSTLAWLQTSFQINLSNTGTYPSEKRMLRELQIKMTEKLAVNKTRGRMML